MENSARWLIPGAELDPRDDLPGITPSSPPTTRPLHTTDCPAQAMLACERCGDFSSDGAPKCRRCGAPRCVSCGNG